MPSLNKMSPKKPSSLFSPTGILLRRISALLRRHRQRKRILAISRHNIRTRVRILDLGRALGREAAVVSVSDQHAWALGVRNWARSAIDESAAVAQVRGLAEVGTVFRGVRVGLDWGGGGLGWVYEG